MKRTLLFLLLVLTELAGGCAFHASLQAEDYANWGARVGERAESAAERLGKQSFTCDKESIRGSDPGDELDVHLCRRAGGHMLISSCFHGVNVFARRGLIERVEVVPQYCVGL